MLDKAECFSVLHFIVCIAILWLFITVPKIYERYQATEKYDEAFEDSMICGHLFGGLKRNQKLLINIQTSDAMVICSETLPVLEFSQEYYDFPNKMMIINSGNYATIYATWANHGCPIIFGGPLKTPYAFFNIKICWEESVHTINGKCFALEMQATYYKVQENFDDLQDLDPEEDDMLVISYLFQSVQENYSYLTSLIRGLKKVKPPFISEHISPLPISCILPPFKTNFYIYESQESPLAGSYYMNRINWIVQSESLCISQKQVMKFRSFSSKSNPRPLKDINAKKVFFYD